jgi:histidinol dehydrogenase
MEIVRTSGFGGRRGRARVEKLAERSTALDRRVMPAAERIVQAVRKDGDKALRAWSRRKCRLHWQNCRAVCIAR